MISVTALRGPVLGDPDGSSGGASSVRVFATQGYAVLFMASLPVIGDPRARNDAYIEQIVAGARAAIETAGIARSGAANRTQNPRGFHAETRSLWEAQEI